MSAADGSVPSSWGKSLVSLAAPGENVIGPAFFYYANATFQVYQDTYGL